MKDLDPLLDSLRFIKSPAEVAAIREATRIAELGIMEAMKSAQPGMYEYELIAAADFRFKQNGAQGFGYYRTRSDGHQRGVAALPLRQDEAREG